MANRQELLRPWWLLPIGRINAWWWILGALVVFAEDYAAGPDPSFPVIYCLVVFAAAWYSGVAPGMALAVVAPLVHWLFLATVWNHGDWFSVTATILRGVLVALVGLWIARFADHERAVHQHVQTLEGLLPICAFCKSIRNSGGKWEPLELYISEHSEAQFSHGFCPDCQRLHYPELQDEGTVRR